MWSNVISIDKEFEREIGYILDKLKCTKDISFAIEESSDRVWIYLASVCELQDKMEKNIFDIVETVVLSFMKLRFFLSKLKTLRLNHANCALLCSLIHFDREFERNALQKAVSDTMDYCLDGLINFRLRALRDNWDELCAVTERLISSSGEENDIYDIAAFITGSDSNKNRLAITQNSLKNLTFSKSVEIVNLFDAKEYNLLSAIIKEHPAEIVVEHADLSAPMNNTLRHIAKVIEK